MSNVIALNNYRAAPARAPAHKARASRKAAPAPAQKPFSTTDSLAPHLFEPGRERNVAVYTALVLATSHASPTSHLSRDPHAALAKARRAVAILQIECAELALEQKGGAL